jgi:hypothetical protein
MLGKNSGGDGIISSPITELPFGFFLIQIFANSLEHFFSLRNVQLFFAVALDIFQIMTRASWLSSPPRIETIDRPDVQNLCYTLLSSQLERIKIL